ncbi:cardiolipin synthase [Yangia mangrovi]|uniref:Cardiolipin synthase n=1 Tax=Alloyangia mangrovi TaxID=1779329 RepID=A0A2A3JX98_9RHOB|nr:cardiolipin synthase [Alloyangia mangrovi]MCT4372602.1 cardiolipin synthase [Alloyangia mangrovi]
MIWIVLHYLIVGACVLRILLRQHRDPSARAAWVLITLAVPVVGVLAYLLFGETSIGRRRLARLRRIEEMLPDAARFAADARGLGRLPRADALFRVGESISGFEPCPGNVAELMADSDATVDAIVADIDAATEHVHLLFYIWVEDNNGSKVAAALMRAAQRGVMCRAMVDDIGSRRLIRSALWTTMKSAGVQLASAYQVGNPLLRIFNGRIDLRNHRKIVVIDGRVTYCGSQNCADPAFVQKAKYAPWVDIMLRIEGPVVQQAQRVFAADWMEAVDEDLSALVAPKIAPIPNGWPAQVVATGPSVRASAMPEMFTSLIYAARDELVLTTPYYVPTEAIQQALCAAAYRGVKVTVIFPARNDSIFVGATSRSYYAGLLASGVSVREYLPGLLHSKTLVVDGEIALIGSANLDRRSFDLNYENNILLVDRKTCESIRQRQDTYIKDARRVTPEEVAAWSLPQRLWQNAVAMVGPIL